MLRRAAAVAALLAAPIGLSGCVAAAIPVIAAGGIAQRELDKRPDSSVAASVPAAATPTPAQPPTAEPGIAADAAPLPAPGLSPQAGSDSAAGTLVAASAAGGYADFARFAAAKAALDPVTSPRNSALLATAGSLQPVTQECSILPPAVIIDLDPAGSKLDSASPLRAEPSLAEGLAKLRSADVTVFWISAATAIEAGRVRDNLAAAGLDPWGRDPLLLMRRSDDRKELRRRETGQTHCVVALAGDIRSDFDELFDFLRNPAAASALEDLIGKGWFLAPSLVATTKDP